MPTDTPNLEPQAGSTTTPTPPKKFNWLILLVVILVILWLITTAGLVYFIMQNRALIAKVDTETPVSKTTSASPSASPAGAGKKSESVSLDDTWNLYTNYDLGFSMKIPKNIYHSYGACEFKTDENSYRPKMALVPVKVVEQEDQVFVTTEYFYELGGEQVKDGTHYYSTCNKVDNSLAKLEDPKTFQEQLWKMIGKSVSTDQELEKFIQDNYGAGCKVGEKKTTSQEGVFDVAIDTGGYSSLEEASAHGCAINYQYYLKYAPTQKHAVTWVFGQSYKFFKTATYEQYDEEMVASFKML